jgi:MFS family permease
MCSRTLSLSLSNLIMADMIFSMVLFLLIGSLSEFTGRRYVCVFGFFCCSIGMALTPLGTELWQCYALRAFVSAGATATGVGITALLADYVANGYKKFATLYMGVAGSLAQVFVMNGCFQFTSEANMNVSWYMLAGACVLCGFMSLLMLQPDYRGFGGPSDGYHPVANGPLVQGRPNTCSRAVSDSLTKLGKGLTASKHPRILLAYVIIFVSRSHGILTLTFFDIYIRHFYPDTNAGKDAADALYADMSTYSSYIGLFAAPVLSIALHLGGTTSMLLFTLIVSLARCVAYGMCEC